MFADEPAPPDSVWIEGHREGYVDLAFTAVPDVDGYLVYREIRVLRDEGTSTFEFVLWDEVERQEEAVIRISLAILDSDVTRWAVSATKDGIESELTYSAALPTSITPASWGRIKTLSR